MHIRISFKSVLLTLLTIVTIGLAAGLYLRSRADQERLLHDSQTIETMLSESPPSRP